MKRRKTRQVRIGNVRVGGGASISIQSMIKVETSDVKSAVNEIDKLESIGCEIIRVAVKTVKDAEAIRDIRKKIKIPLVADIHFDYRLALKAIACGADKIRINPGNMRKSDEIAQVVSCAKKAKIPIRIGVNSGSVSGSGVRGPGFGKDLSSALVNSAMQYIKIFEGMDFCDIIISLKASDVVTTVDAYRKISKACDYPLHLGVTASGPYDYGIIKSSIGIGALLLDGIGDTIRVSLTADPDEEVIAAKRILSALGLRKFGPQIISCPTCGRCQVDLVKIVNELERRVQGPGSRVQKNITIAVMGCEVNGPGEAREADIGVAFGKNAGFLFKKGKIIKRISSQNAVKELLKII